MTLIKSISGIRGTIGGAPGEGLSPVDIVKFTYAYCEKMKERLWQAAGGEVQGGGRKRRTPVWRYGGAACMRNLGILRS